MNTDLMKVQKLVSCVNGLIGIIEGELTDDLLDQYLKTAINLSNLNFTDLEIAAAKNDLTYFHQVKCTPGESLLDDYDDIEWYKNIKDTIEPKFWSRYSNYLIDKKHFSPNVVATLGNETLDRDIMNYLGNPNSNYNFFKRGLIIGDVQSGKTSTYIGLMCKAADAGYKVFILLTGTIEGLRKQTQERVEEGFIGIDMSSDKSNKRVGVGLDNKKIFAVSLTSRKGDFTGKSDQIAMSLQDNDAVVFVLKKNSSVLSKLIDWLKTTAANRLTGKIDTPMLLIDDEADNASINTSKSKEDPSKINKLIRELASLFSKSNYVGFTATPYANVFIDPITTEDMLNHDLFPENFIYALPTPNNYIGPQQTFNKKGKYYNQLIFIKDAGRVEEDGWPFYFKHKKDWEDTLPESLTDAIYTFYLANAIRDIRGHLSSHRSMLINISRFVRVQYYIKDKVSEIHDAAYRAVKFNLNPNDFENSMKDPIINRIYNNWVKHYSNVEFIAWDDIAKVLFNAIKEIQIKVVNSTQKNDKLVYTDDSPIRVIAIGGLALSRGLTLEGLLTSYFFRNTATYDVLMQMGRWFGYRKDYDDLFRIWTHEDSARWYAEIAEATDILKQDMQDMRDKGMSPKDFGIRVRDDCTELQITARNKMRSATDEYEFSGYAGKIVETPYLFSDATKNRRNFSIIEEFVQDSIIAGKQFEKMQGSGEHYVLQNVEKGEILKLLCSLNISRYNHEFYKDQIIDYISSESDKYIDMWDVAFMDGNDDRNTIDLCGRKIKKVSRNNCSIEGERLKIGQRGKLGGPTDGKIGIVDFNNKKASRIVEDAISDFEEFYKQEHYGDEFKKGRQYPSNTWFKFIKDRKPLLIVYLIDVNCENSKAINAYRDEMIDRKRNIDIPSVGVAIGFPQNDNVHTSKKKYKANLYYNYFEREEDELEAEEE